jgi:hypothetical protein
MSATTINFRIDEQSKDELQGIAEERGLKVSSLVRDIITDFLEDYCPPEQESQVVVLPIPPNYNHFH